MPQRVVFLRRLAVSLDQGNAALAGNEERVAVSYL